MNTKHLKAKILDLAIRGKLVPQDSSEGNAADLLKKIREEKNKLNEQKKIKAEKKSSFIIKAEDGRHYEQFADGSLIDIEDEIPCSIPNNWQWTRLKGVSAEILYGVSESAKKKGKYKLLRITDIQNDKVDWATVPYTDYDEKTVESYLLKKGDLVFARTGATVGKSFLINENIENAIYASYLIRVRPSLQIYSKYIKYYFQSVIYWNQVTDKSLGNGQPNVNGTSLANLLIPLPPLSEQQRIVSAIEKAFEQIDIIEKNKLSLKTYIKQTKSKVLDLAIHGKLVGQNPKEGNAFELLEKIRKEKNELIKQKKLKEDKKSSFIIKAENGKHYEHFADGTLKEIEDEIPFEIPENWCWCRLRDIGIYKKGPFGSALTKAMFVSKSDSTIKVYEQQNAIKKNHELGHYYIKRDYFESDMKGFEVHPGDIIVSCAGTIGETYILPENIEKGIINQALMKMTITNELSVQFFLMYFDHILKTASADSGKGTAMKNIPPFDIFKQFLFPLPPLLEQKRIVKKIDQIFEQLDILEKSLGD